jgi:hypothetical protein
MRLLLFLLTIMVILYPHSAVAEASIGSGLQVSPEYRAIIDSPRAGQVIQGSVVIRGKMDTGVFQSFELGFAYANDPTHTWFLILESTAPVPDGVLGTWDTSNITDGVYTLRLLVTLTDGAQVEALVKDLRVRNYTPIETDTPSPTPIYVTLAPGIPAASDGHTPTPTQRIYPITPTPLPTNPAVITPAQITLSLGKGAMISIGILSLLGIYLGLGSILHRKN